MTDTDRKAVEALAHHFAYQDGEWWDLCPAVKQETYRARALDVVQVLSLIYQGPGPTQAQKEHYSLRGTFTRPMSKDSPRTCWNTESNPCDCGIQGCGLPMSKVTP